jgi:dolichyl-phosphate beta-glucosyltransferase
MGFIHSGYDIVIGSRRIKGADIRIRQPIHRRILGRGFGLLTEIVFLWGIKDSQCGFKLFKSGVAKKAFEKRQIDGFSFDVEVLYIARKKLHARIREVPVVWSDSAGLSKVRAGRETFRMLKDLFRIRMLH